MKIIKTLFNLTYNSLFSKQIFLKYFALTFLAERIFLQHGHANLKWNQDFHAMINYFEEFKKM